MNFSLAPNGHILPDSGIVWVGPRDGKDSRHRSATCIMVKRQFEARQFISVHGEHSSLVDHGPLPRFRVHLGKHPYAALSCGTRRILVCG